MKSKKSSNKKWIIWGILIVLVILVILAVAKGGSKGQLKVSTDIVQLKTIVETVSANGKIQPETDVKISPYISGEVKELYVKEGDTVQTSDLLAVIDPEIYRSNYERIEASLNTQKANLASARARLAQAKAQYAREEQNFKRSKQLYDQGVISEADFDAANAAYQVAEAEVQAAMESVQAAEYTVASARASLEEAEENLRRTNIYAPNSGTVSKLNVEVGERVVGASQFSAGTEIMTIANLHSMEVNVEVNENDIVRVEMGDTCTIEVDAYLDKEFKGVVTEIATSANTTGVSADQVTNFDVKIHILRESYVDLIPEDKPHISPFKPGMSATVDIQTETAEGVLAVPIQAVTTRPDTSGRLTSKLEELENEKLEEKEGVESDDKDLEVVFLYQDGKAILQVVETGIQDNTYIEIEKGLQEDQEVISSPYSAVSRELENRMEVEKVAKKDLFKDN